MHFYQISFTNEPSSFADICFPLQCQTTCTSKQKVQVGEASGGFESCTNFAIQCVCNWLVNTYNLFFAARVRLCLPFGKPRKVW